MMPYNLKVVRKHFLSCTAIQNKQFYLLKVLTQLWKIERALLQKLFLVHC